MAITRTEAAELFQEGFSTQVIEVATEQSVALQTIPTIPVSDKTTRVPVLTALPTAGFLAAEGDAKPETDMAWDSVSLVVEEIAAIVAIDDSTLADAKIDIASSVRDRLGEAFAKTIDGAVFFGTNAPGTWPSGGIDGAIAAGDKVDYVNGESFGEAFDKVENKGAVVDRVWAGRSTRSMLRHTKDSSGDALPDVNTDSMYGVPVNYPLGWVSSSTPGAGAWSIHGDSSAAVIGVRQDMTFSVSNEATLSTFGSLWEKDATAIRAVMRVGFALANPVYIRTGGQAYPFSKVWDAA